MSKIKQEPLALIETVDIEITELSSVKTEKIEDEKIFKNSYTENEEDPVQKSQKILIKDKQKKYRCKACNKTFKSKLNLKVHKRENHTTVRKRVKAIRNK